MKEPDFEALAKAPVKRALVVGSAECVWEDLGKVFPWQGVVCAVNQIGLHLPNVDYWVSLHPENLVTKWAPKRPELQQEASVWSHKSYRWVRQTLPDWGGSSGLFGVKVMLSHGFNRIVCAGIPLDGQHHFNIKREWPDCMSYRKAWQKRAVELRPFVRSVSGWTKKTLGEPTKGWLELN